jgi:hypothetical protein
VGAKQWEPVIHKKHPGSYLNIQPQLELASADVWDVMQKKKTCITAKQFKNLK